MSTPLVFVSYSHDSLDHKRWVLELSTRLRKSGVDVILDQWELGAGEDLASFMISNLKRSDRVLMICTPNYVKKADAGIGDVGVERMILTAEYLASIDSKKVIPVIKHHGNPSVPSFFETKIYIDFSKSDEYESSFDDLLRNILGKPLIEKPEIGKSPFDKDVSVVAQTAHDPLKDLMRLLISYYEKKGYNHMAIDDIHRSGISTSRTMTDLIINNAVQKGYVSFDKMNHCVWLKDKGKLYAVENELV